MQVDANESDDGLGRGDRDELRRRPSENAADDISATQATSRRIGVPHCS
jgi:hypothetical protein